MYMYDIIKVRKEDKQNRKGVAMKYNLKKIMLKAWEIFRKRNIAFSEALHRAWNVAKAEKINKDRIKTAAAAAGVSEYVSTWAGWRRRGFEVISGSKAAFKVVLIWASKGDGKTYKVSFFTRSQVQRLGTP